MMHAVKEILPWFSKLGLLVTALIVLASSAAAQNAEAKVSNARTLVMPDGAEEAGVGGTVIVSANVDKSGKVTRAVVVAGPSWPCGSQPSKHIDRVRDAVRDNVLATTFSPELRSGKPDGAELLLTFALGEEFRNSVAQNDFSAALNAGKNPTMMDVGSIYGRTPKVRAISLPKPPYPSKARAARASGAVPVRVVIDVTGAVVAAGAVGGIQVLQDAAREASCGARFEPTTVDGRPVRVTGVIVYNFVP
jgi:TonB family protein